MHGLLPSLDATAGTGRSARACSLSCHETHRPADLCGVRTVSTVVGRRHERAQASPQSGGWTEVTHGAGVRPAYARLFATDRVHAIRITISAERFRAMQADLRLLTPPMPSGQPRFERPAVDGSDPPALPSFGGDRRNGPTNFSVRNPIYVPVTVHHDGHVWTNVGMRYK